MTLHYAVLVQQQYIFHWGLSRQGHISATVSCFASGAMSSEPKPSMRKRAGDDTAEECCGLSGLIFHRF